MKPPIENPRPDTGFTLVELLVVVTIIVILIALLVPALDRAIYQAELTVCGSNLHNIGAGGIGYAIDHKRRYPDSERPRTVDTGFQPDVLGREDSLGTDFRTPIEGYIALALLRCPLTGAVDLSREGNDSVTWVFANYDLWFSWRFVRQGAPEPGMFKLGDAFQYAGRRFRLLASDKHLGDQIDGWDQASHPDDAGVMFNQALQNYSDLPGVGAVEKKTHSRWGSTTRRGLLDLNFGSTDGAVLRANGVIIDHPNRTPDHDTRLSRVPAHGSDIFAPNWWAWIPASE